MKIFNGPKVVFFARNAILTHKGLALESFWQRNPPKLKPG